MIYEELVKRLRNAAQWSDKGLVITPSICLEAADAIEELICTVADEHNARLDAEERQRWTPVTERLPEKRTNVLAMTADCDIYVCDFIPSVRQFWTIPGDELHIDDISHWMPLPEPPKEES